MSAKNSSRRISRAAALLTGTSLLAVATTAVAQPRQMANAPEEIIVTARKREESIMKTPVVIQAISAKQVENLKISDMSSLASVTPGLTIGDAFVAVGATVFLRGLGNGDSAQYIDQSVALNIDGVNMAHGSFYRTGMFDVGQIEVLKGPQALFFGRSTSAGIIAIHSADPTSTWQAKATVGYEFNADETQVSGFVSGPITDKLGVRLAGFHNDMKGWMYSQNPNARDKRYAMGDDGARLTLKYDDPDIGLRAKLKVSTVYAKGPSPNNTSQGACVGPTYQKDGTAVGYYDNCKIDNIMQGPNDIRPYRPDLNYADPASYFVGSPSKLFGDGVPQSRSKATQIALSVDYDLAPGLTLTSLTGYSWVYATQRGNVPLASNSPVGFEFQFAGRYWQQDYSQELRVTSDWKDSWINFTAGGYGASTLAKDQIPAVIPAFASYSDDTAKFATDTWSVFGQVRLTPIEKWELDAGVRYTKIKRELKNITFINSYGLPQGDLTSIIPQGVRKISEDNASPEVTVSYNPTDELTLFASYKQGYKGPGFNFNQTAYTYAPGVITSFGGEKARGFEGGVKAQLFDQQVRLTAAAYSYKYIGQQVSFVNNLDLSVVTSNGANVKLQGVELGVTYAPETMEGLTLDGFVNYNHANYSSFPSAPCFGNQTAAQGCNTDPVTGARSQNLGGKQIHRAPRWSGQFGVDYRTDVTDELGAGVNVHMNFSSAYNSIPEMTPMGRQSPYATFDASVRFGKLEGLWELALIGRNITNKYVISGGLDNGAFIPNTPADGQVYVYRPRQVMLQLTVRPEL